MRYLTSTGVILADQFDMGTESSNFHDAPVYQLREYKKVLRFSNKIDMFVSGLY
jgi:hypothetical protein